MIMATGKTNRSLGRAQPLEALYPRDEFVVGADGVPMPIYLGHPQGRCDICEAAFSNQIFHPVSPEHDDVVVLCGGHLMRLTTRLA